MVEWCRNRDWNDAIAADFEARLARTRHQRAQYLRIQGSCLKDSHPDVAVRLLRRCVDVGDPAFIAAALLDIAQALYGTGDVGGALDELEAVLVQEQREPMFRTTAAFDYPFLVALHEQGKRYDHALKVIARAGAGFFADLNFEREAALALILSARGEHARAAEAAGRALQAAEIQSGWIPGFPQVGVVPPGDHPIKDRLRRLAARSNS